MLSTSQIPVEKPKLRGVLHQYGFFVALVLNAFLLSQTETQQEFYSILLYAVGLNALLGTSTLYHRIDWSPKWHFIMRRLDHTMIFVLIASSYSPFGLIAFDSPKNTFVLYTLWGAVLVGFLLKIFWIHSPNWLSALSYVAAGWLVAIMTPSFIREAGLVCAILMLLGGVIYTIGACFYALRRPDLKPGVFGYHELFHSFVLAGALCHYMAIYFLLQ
ncbi:MAG: hemolysin III family protein [Myxococcota bacterium]|nr:hemolysin III family protein [Myxococcota bacterium]